MADDVPLREHVEKVAAERGRTNAVAFVGLVATGAAIVWGNSKATAVLAEYFKTRMEGTNEWRGALEDQTKTKATVQQVEALEGRIERLDKQVEGGKMRTMGMGQIIGWAIGGLGAIAIIVNLANYLT